MLLHKNHKIYDCIKSHGPHLTSRNFFKGTQGNLPSGAEETLGFLAGGRVSIQEPEDVVLKPCRHYVGQLEGVGY